MKYKVGDEVLVKCKIIGDLKDGRYKVTNSGNSRIVCETVRHLFPVEEEVYPVSKELDMNAEEAWELVDKIYSMSDKLIFEIFGTDDGMDHILQNFTPQEAKEKIESWEQLNEIKVGDVVNIYGDKGIVIYIVDEKVINVMFKSGYVSSYDRYVGVKKTGRHIDIDKILKQIGEIDA